MIWLSYRLQMLSAQHCQRWLADAEWQYAQTLSEKRARQFCNGRALVRKMLQHIHAAEINDIAISLPSDTAPTLFVGKQHWHLSLSHSKDAIAVALSHSDKVGVDIEQLKPRQYSQWQKDYIALQPATGLNAFYQRWTMTEAYSKYSATPLLQALREGVPSKTLAKHIPLPGYMLCLVYQHTNTEITLTEST